LSVVQRKYFTEVAALAEKTVAVVTTTGRTFNGSLIGINPDNLSLCIADAKDDSGNFFHRLFLNGSVVAQLEKVFPTMVKLYEDKGFIWVMDKVKLTEKGVVEGSGPAADRVQRVYEQFMSEVKV
jgi:small nuclear ribonucleoprotein (snRNP)-like protein